MCWLFETMDDPMVDQPVAGQRLNERIIWLRDRLQDSSANGQTNTHVCPLIQEHGDRFVAFVSE